MPTAAQELAGQGRVCSCSQAWGAGTPTSRVPAWEGPAVQGEAEPTAPGLGLEQLPVPKPVQGEQYTRRATASSLAPLTGRLTLVLAKGLPAFSVIKSL